MEVKIKKLHPDAVTPYKTHSEDFCYDVVATSCDEIAPNIYKYGIGLAFEIDRDISNPFCQLYKIYGDSLRPCLESWQLSIDFRPRSSVWRTGMVLSNCAGTIDELYRGEVSAVFYHIMPNMPKYEVGQRIGQIKLGLTLPMDFTEVATLTDTERGTGGYGSTGV